MKNLEQLPNLKITNRDLDKGLVEIELSDNVMENPSSIYFLDRHSDLIIDEIIETKILPKKITQLKLKILPTDYSKYYYSLLGIETIIFNLFNRIQKKRIQEDLKRSETVLKIYYINDELYNIPVICIELYFFRKLLNETINFLNNTLRLEIFYFTGFIGEINIIDNINKIYLRRTLKRPLLVGQPEFKKNGVLKTYNFSKEQIVDMNFIHLINVKQLQMKYILNNANLSIFDDIRDMIKASADDLKKDSEEVLCHPINNVFDKDEIGYDLPF